MLVSDIQVQWFRYIYVYIYVYIDFPGSLIVKNPPANARDMDSIPELGSFLQEGNGACNIPYVIPWVRDNCIAY